MRSRINRSMKINDLFDFHAPWVLLEIVKMRSQSDFMRRESKPSIGTPATFVVHKISLAYEQQWTEWSILSNRMIYPINGYNSWLKNNLTVSNTKLMRKQKKDLHNHTECSIIAIIKRFWRMRCLHSRKRRQTSAPNDWTEQSPKSLIWNPKPEEHFSDCHDK